MPARKKAKKNSRARKIRQSGEGVSDVIKKIGKVARQVYSGVKSANNWAKKNRVVSSVLKNPLVGLAGKSFGVDTKSYGEQAEKMGYGMKLHGRRSRR